MAGKISSLNANGKKLTLTNSDFLFSDKNVTYLDTVEQATNYVGTNGDVIHISDIDRGGVFIYDDTATDNGGTVFGKCVRQYEGAVNVKWFGAKGNGIKNDYEAFASIVSTMPNGGDIFVPEGVFFIGSTIDFYVLLPNSDSWTNLNIIGEGASKSCLKSDFDGILLHLFNGSSISKVKLLGPSEKGENYENSVGLESNPTQGIIELCEIRNFYKGIVTKPTGAVITRNNIVKNNYGIYTESSNGYGGNLMKIKNNYIHYNSLGLYLYDMFTSEVVSNAFEYNDKSFYIRSPRDCIIGFNWLENDTQNSEIVNSNNAIYPNKVVNTGIEINFTSSWSGLPIDNSFIGSTLGSTEIINKFYNGSSYLSSMIQKGTDIGCSLYSGINKNRTIKLNVDGTTPSTPALQILQNSDSDIGIISVENNEYYPSGGITIFKGKTYTSGGNSRRTSIVQNNAGELTIGASSYSNHIRNVIKISYTGLYPSSEGINLGSSGSEWTSIHSKNIHATGGEITFSSLPTSDPGIEGRIWNDNSTLKVSAG